MNKENMLKKYAELTVKKGVNVQEGQTVLINSPIECSEFARAITEAAYLAGAKDVIVHYNDEKLQKIKLTHSSIETLSNVPNWIAESYTSYAREGACVISISASNPDAYKGIPIEKVSTLQKAKQVALKEYYDYSMSNKIRWTVVSVPTESWALKMYPDKSKDEAISALWDVIFKVVRLDKNDPIEAWNNHNKNLQEKLRVLNEKKFKKLHFKNNSGTDLTIELPAGHIWLGGSETCQSGIEFNANMPTEEVFTLPKKDGVNGTVASSKPLSYNGNLIDDFTLTFENGKVVNFTAGVGYDSLKKLLESDDGAKYLGEVALVPHDSPISNSNLIFYNTLFDENAACHLAFGNSYPICLEGGTTMSKEELMENGANTSLVHVDFMIGTSDMEIYGIIDDSDSISIFSKGNWAF